MKWIRAGLGVLGVAVMAYAITGAAADPGTSPTRQLTFMLAVLVGQDTVLMPAILLAGLLVTRFVPASVRGVVQTALIVSAAVTVIAAVLIVNAGRHPSNPSLLPLDYRRGLLAALAVIWAVAAIVAVARRWRAHHTRHGARST
jgi:hypothetical protein